MAGASTSGTHQTWSSRLTFVLATIGFSVGLGNIWRFPYLAGESGGGAFVLIYLLCVVVIGVPIVMAELVIGRLGRMTPAAAMARLARAEGKSGLWGLAGGLAMLTAFLITTFYCVIGGWTLHYIYLATTGALCGIDSARAQAHFDALLASPALLIFWQAVFLGLNALVVGRGLHHGIERAVTVMMPMLFILLVGLAGYGLVAGDAARGLSFLFKPDFSAVTGKTFIDAMGQAFFSVGVGMAAMMTYGAYLPKSVNMLSTAAIISFADTGVALIAGLAVFPFVFALGLSPSEGPGLVFVAVPAALSHFGGGYAAAPFFVLLAVAALTSSIALFEVLVSWGEERGWPRPRTAIGAALLCWVIGLATVFSCNIASGFYPLPFIPGLETATMFDIVDKVTSTIGLPLGGLFAALFAGWVMPGRIIAAELGFDPAGVRFRIWRFLVRWLLPTTIAWLIVAGVRG